jgi:hypothetical protein
MIHIAQKPKPVLRRNFGAIVQAQTIANTRFSLSFRSRFGLEVT